MARDNAPRDRQRRQLERKKPQRQGYDRILIVSEGSKTEPNYFNEIRQAKRISTAHIHVRPSQLGTAPLQVVEYAEQLFCQGDEHKQIDPRAFEQVYAIFDRDNHETYHQALDKAAALDGRLRNHERKPVSFKAIASIPSFELWLLLHFEDIQSPLHRDEVISRLRTHLNDYEKGADGVFGVTHGHMETAMTRARVLCEERGNSAYTDPEPFTAVYELVDMLMNLG